MILNVVIFVTYGEHGKPKICLINCNWNMNQLGVCRDVNLVEPFDVVYTGKFGTLYFNRQWTSKYSPKVCV